MKQEQQKIRSTKPLPTKEKLEAESSHNQESKTQDCFLYCKKIIRNNILRHHWNISDYFESHQLVHCHLL